MAHNLALNGIMLLLISEEVLFFSTVYFIVPVPAACFPASNTFSVAFNSLGGVPIMPGLKITFP